LPDKTDTARQTNTARRTNAATNPLRQRRTGCKLSAFP
jgi:hypothetical protein